jgi:hypothetical protein
MAKNLSQNSTFYPLRIECFSVRFSPAVHPGYTRSLLRRAPEGKSTNRTDNQKHQFTGEEFQVKFSGGFC